MSILALIFLPFFLGITLYLVIQQPRARLALALLGLLAETLLLITVPTDSAIQVLGISLQLAPLPQLFLPFLWWVAAALLLQAGSPPHSENFVPLLLLIMGGVSGVLLAGDPFVAVVLLQLAGTGVVFLIPHRDDLTPSTTTAGRYLTMAFASGVIMLLGLMIADLHRTDPEDLTALRLATAVLTVGFGLRLAALPFHIWLPELAEKAPPMTTALVVTIVDVTALLLLVSIVSTLPPLVTDWRSSQLLLLGGSLGAVGGAILALGERSLSRMLAYSTSYHLGFIIFGLGAATAASWVVALFAIVCHVLAKLLLFTCLSSLRRSPAPSGNRPSASVALGLAVGGLVIVGAPPLAGFTVNWPLLAIATEASGALALVLLGATALLFLAYLRALRRLLAEGNEASPRSVEALPLRGLIILLVVLLIGLGLYPTPLLTALSQVVARLPFPGS